jgi:hypothetical protein
MRIVYFGHVAEEVIGGTDDKSVVHFQQVHRVKGSHNEQHVLKLRSH